MPLDVAPVAAPVVNTPGVAPTLVTPPAEQPPEPKRERPFHERFEAKERELGVDSDDDAETADEPEAPAATAKPAPGKKAPAATKPDRRAELESIAKELGYSLDGNVVTVAERADWRATKKREHDALAAREQAVKALESSAGSNEQVKRATAILDAIEKGDPEGFAAAVGTKDFNEFQESFIKRLADPNYKELRELQKWRDEEKGRAEKTEQEAAQRAEQQKRGELRAGYMKNLSETASKSTDKLAATMADDPMFLNVLFQIQSENWDPTEQKTLTIEQALDRGVRGSKTTLREELKGLYERLGKAFGAAAQAAAVATLKNGKPAPKTAVTPTRTVDASGATKPWSERTQAEWAAYRNKRFAEAVDKGD